MIYSEEGVIGVHMYKYIYYIKYTVVYTSPQVTITHSNFVFNRSIVTKDTKSLRCIVKHRLYAYKTSHKTSYTIPQVRCAKFYSFTPVNVQIPDGLRNLFLYIFSLLAPSVVRDRA